MYLKNKISNIFCTFLFTGVVFFSNCFIDCEDTKPFRNEIAHSLERHLSTFPPEYPGDTCFHTTDMLIFNVNNNAIDTVVLSDGASSWLKQEIVRLQQSDRFEYKKLNRILKEARIKKGQIIIPLIMETYAFPCGLMSREKTFKNSSFQIQGKNLAGNIITTDPIVIKLPARILSLARINLSRESILAKF